MKRLVIFLVLFVVVAAIVVLVMSQKSAPATPLPPSRTPGSSTPAPKPTFPDVTALLSQPSYTIGSVSGAFPRAVEEFTVQPSESIQTTINRLATVFHMNTLPTADTSIDGTYYTWSSVPGLIVGPNGQHVDYSAPADTTVRIADADAVYMQLGRQLVTSVLQWYPVQPASTLYFAPIQNDLNFVTRDKATAIQLTFLPTLGGLPLIAGDPKTSETVVRYNAAKSLIYYSGFIYPKIVSTGKSLPVITLQEAETRLVAGQGSILSASSQTDINTHDTPLYRFAVSTITSARLAYYFNFKNNQLSPVFLLYGKATDTTTQKQVDTVSAVSAVP